MLKSILTPVLFVFAAVTFASADLVTLTSVGPGSAGGPTIDNGVYVYPYYLKDGSETFAVSCTTYDNHVTLGESWQANLSTFNSLSNVAHYGDVKDYAEIAWLFDHYSSNTTANADINFAIWSFFSAAAQASAGYDATAQKWRADAEAWYINGGASSYDFSSFVIFTPAYNLQTGFTSSLPQEYIGKVPEPGTLLLAGSGFLLVFFRSKLR